MANSLRVSLGVLVLASACTAPAPKPAAEVPAPAPVVEAPPAPPVVAERKKQEPPKIDPEARARYRAALVAGRELHHKKDYRGAIASFEQALAIDPDDPRALAELGWAAFFVPDLELAEAKTRAALARMVDAKARGAALYNLGRIMEEKADVAGAIALYQQSLEARPNDTVRDRLTRLDAAAAAARDVLTPVAMRGPFASLREYCAGHTTGDGETIPCDPAAALSEDIFEGPTAAPRGDGPILEARVLWASGGTVPTPDAEVLVMLAIRTDKGWWVGPPVADIYNPGAFGILASLKSEALELVQLIPGGAPELRFRFVSSRYDSDMGINEFEESAETAMVLCGIGPSGKPACTGAIPQGYKAERAILFPEEDEPGAQHEGLTKTEYALTTTIGADGTLTIAGSGKLPDHLKPMIGARPLAFP